MSLFVPILLALGAQDATAADEELLSFYCAGAEKVFVDPKDAALLAALRLLDDRLMELPHELHKEHEIPPDAIPMLTRMFSGPISLRIGISGEAMPGMPLPIFAQLAMPELSEGEAGEVAARVGRLLELAGMPPAQFDANGMAAFPGPFPAWFGSEAGNFVMAVGKTTDPVVDPSGHGLPAGVEPTLYVNVDYARFFEVGMGFAEAYGGEDMADVSEMLTLFGLDKLRFEVASGSDAERSHSIMRMPGYAKTMRDTGTMPAGPMSLDALRFIPQDAVWAYAGAVNMRGGMELAMKMAKEDFAEATGGGDPLEMIAGMLGGVHLMDDLVDHLGTSYGMYASDTTGGGGFLSMVMFMELAAPDEFYDSQETLSGMLNAIASAQAMGYVQARYWEHEGTDYQTLTFPGLPVPFEPTIAHAKNYMFMGITPAATMAAVAQAKSGTKSLLDNARFMEQLPGDLEGAYAMSFFDSPRLIKDGYGMVSLMCSALVNATRSPSNPQRDAGVIIPPYHELAAGAKATVSLVTIEGEDYVQRYQGDRSVLVGATSGLGFLGSSPLLLLVPAIALAGMNGQF